MKAIAENLSTAGQLVSDEELILYILGGVGQEYDPVVISLTSPCDEVTLQQVQFMLQSQDMRLEQINSVAAARRKDTQNTFTTEKPHF